MAEKLSNPGPLGLMAFGMTTVLLNLANAGLFKVDSMILSMGIFFGGLAQIIAGILEYKRGNTFGTVAFTSYGMFWETFVFLNVIPLLSGMSAFAVSTYSVGCYLALWGFFTFLMFFGTLKLNRGLQVVFFTLTVLYVLLAGATFSGIALIGTIAGYEGIFVGLSAMYVAIAEIINEVSGHIVLSVGPVKSEVKETPIADQSASKSVTAPGAPAMDSNTQYGIWVPVSKLSVEPILASKPVIESTTSHKPAEKIGSPSEYANWVCNVCGFEYHEKEGLPDADIPPGTKFTAILDDKVCPGCGAPKTEFKKKQ